MERREVLASDIGAIVGIAFVDQAGDGSSEGDPPVLIDSGGNLVAPGVPGAQGIQVQLFEDTNDDGQLDGGDLLIGTDTTNLVGRYRFDDLAPGDYFVQQQTVTGLVTPDASLVTVSNDAGVQTALIDDYSLTTQSVTATSGNVGIDSAVAVEAIGNERDILVSNSAPTGQVTIFVDDASDTLSVGSLGDAVGTALIQYDGPDASVTLDAQGLAGVSLAGGLVGAQAEANSGLIVLSRAENPGDSLFITVYTDAGNSSTATIPLQEDDATFIESFVRFSDFVTASGTGADFNNVGAIEASIGISANNDAFVSIIEARRPDLVEANLANILPVSLGGQLFRDDSGAGLNNGMLDGGEAGLVGIAVDLYKLDGADDVVDPSTSTPLTSTNTGAGGTYNFAGLDPGHYAVVVSSSQFQQGAPLFGLANSTGNDPAGDPDNDVDDDDNGSTAGSGDVVSGTISLVSNDEPTNDDDSDPNTNTTLDLGFYPQIDLVITKSLNQNESTLVAGGIAVFDFEVQNLGPLDATGVEAQDIFPAGLTFKELQNASGAFTIDVNGSVVDVVIGGLGVGQSATFQLTADIDPNQTGALTNSATVKGAEVDIDPSTDGDSDVVELPVADLRIEMSGLSDPVTAGSQLTYEIIVTNDGPDEASGVIVADQLPGDVSFSSGHVAGDDTLVVDNGNGQIVATVGALAPNAAAIITIIVDVDANAAGPLTNTAEVTSTPDADPDSSNNTASVDTQVDRMVDVGIAKTSEGTGVAGDDLTFVIAVTNTGPSQARGVNVTDTLATELTLVPGSFDPGASGITLSEDGQNLTFDVGLLDPGQTETFRFDVTIDSSTVGNVFNTADISTTDIDTDDSNDSGFVSVGVEQRVDLVLDKTAVSNTAVPGQDEIVYTLTVSHSDGSISDASSVTITDTIPAGLVGTVINAPDADSTDFDGGVVTVVYNSIPIGETRTFTVRADVDEASVGTITNDGEVTSAGVELEPSDNVDVAVVALTPDFDVSVDKSVDDPSPGPTDTVTYTVSLENDGPSTAPDVVLSDDIPAGLTFVSGILDGQAATSDGSTVVFPSIAIESGVMIDATLIFTVDIDTDGLVTNNASVPDMSADGENDITNNSDSAVIDVVAQVDLEIENVVSLEDAINGSELTYTITVTNAGPSPAVNVEVVDTLPAGVEFVSGTGPNGEQLSAVGRVVTVDAGDVLSGASFEITIIGNVADDAVGEQVNVAIVSSDTEEIDPSNNTASARTSIDPSSSTFSGLVFHDRNANGMQDANEPGIADVVLTMTGADFLGNVINLTITTDANGMYEFENLAEGTYEVTQTQPEGFRSGQSILGFGATAVALENQFAQIALGRDLDAFDFIFSELSLPLSKRSFLASS